MVRPMPFGDSVRHDARPVERRFVMAESSQAKAPKREYELPAIKERLRANKLTADDLKRLESLIVDVERASKALRAAMIE
jgi:hypothetical protein